MNWRFFGSILLIAVGVALAVSDLGSMVASGIRNPTCELISPGTYRIDFESSPDAGPVEVFASSRPDRIDSDKPVFTIQTHPAEVSVPESTRRIYFHLKPKFGAARVVSTRRLPLEGARNFRDLGGYRTSAGRYVRWGLVYRSDYLANLTPRDSEYLSNLGIRLVCDVRAEGERARSPDHWMGPPPEFFLVPIGPNRDGTLTSEELKLRVEKINSQTKDDARGYDYAITDAAQYGKILHRIAAGDLPVVEHCTSGKDRTGVFSAILLTALGVPRETVIQDYLLTNRYMLGPNTIEKTRKDLQRIFGLSEPLDMATVKAIMTTRPEMLEVTFGNITQKYGSFDNYLREGLKISDSELAAIRQRLLEP
jgi:protein-tyrosine phosphatase